MSCVAWLQCADPRWLDGATAAGSYGRPTLHRTTTEQPTASFQCQSGGGRAQASIRYPHLYILMATYSIHTFSCARDNHYCLLKHELEDKILLNINVRGRGEGSQIMSAELRK